MSFERENHKDSVFYVGNEVNTTPAQGMKTMFVNGVRSIPQTIELAHEHNCKHVYLGANRSFQKNKLWNEIIPALLHEGFRVSLEYPADAMEYIVDLLPSEIINHPYFFPIVSCQIAKVETFSKNLVIKVDDSDFAATNSGTWCIAAAELLDRNRFTSWEEYSNDEVIIRDADIKAMRVKKKEDKEE